MPRLRSACLQLMSGRRGQAADTIAIYLTAWRIADAPPHADGRLSERTSAARSAASRPPMPRRRSRSLSRQGPHPGSRLGGPHRAGAAPRGARARGEVMFCGTLVGVAWLDVATAGGLRAGGPSGTLECREVTNALFAPGPPRFAVATSATVSAP